MHSNAGGLGETNPASRAKRLDELVGPVKLGRPHRSRRLGRAEASIALLASRSVNAHEKGTPPAKGRAPRAQPPGAVGDDEGIAGTSSRAEAIAGTLRAQILNGKYEAGERLPSERELSARTGANRSSVREALKKLEQLGMIAIRPGGARVVPLEDAGLGVLRHMLSDPKPNREIVEQWLDVYELVIAGAARFAVERGTEEELAAGKRLLRRLVSVNTSEDEFVAISDQLTELIAVASRNVVLRMVRNGLVATEQRQVDARRKLRASRKALIPIVRDVEHAITRRDPSGTEEGVRRLLRANRTRIIELIAGPHSRGSSDR